MPATVRRPREPAASAAPACTRGSSPAPQSASPQGQPQAYGRPGCARPPCVPWRADGRAWPCSLRPPLRRCRLNLAGPAGEHPQPAPYRTPPRAPATPAPAVRTSPVMLVDVQGVTATTQADHAARPRSAALPSAARISRPMCSATWGTTAFPIPRSRSTRPGSP